MRLFTALDPPDEVRDQISALRSPGALDARWSAPAQYHVTLRFVGDTDPEQADRYESALSRIDEGPAHCVPYGLDALPSRRNPRVLIVGLERTDTLLSLYHAVSDALEREGLEPEDRPYRPHVTLARLDDVAPRAVHEFLDDHDASAPASFRAETFFLYESTLTPDGAVHEKRASFSVTA